MDNDMLNKTKYKHDKNQWFSNETPSWVERLLVLVFRVRHIIQDGKLYLRRFYLTPRWNWLPKRVFLHHILLSDTDSALHDHPFPFKTRLIKGSYIEVTEGYGWTPELGSGTITIQTPYREGSVIEVPAIHKHRLIIGKSVWTLVVAGKAERIWGFWPSGDFVPWYKFLDKNPNSEYAEDMVAQYLIN